MRAAAGRLGIAFVVVAITASFFLVTLVVGASVWFDFRLTRLLYDALAIGGVLAWLGVALVRREWLPASRLSLAIAAILGAFLLATLASRNPRLSAQMTVYVLLLVELYLLLVALMRRQRYRQQIERTAILLAFLACVLYLVQVTQAWSQWWSTVGRLTVPPLRPGYLGLSVGPNPLATLVMLLGAFGLASGQLRGRRGRAASVVMLVLVATVVVLTGSRGAWIGAVAGLGATALVGLLFLPGLRSGLGGFMRSRTGRIALVVASVALVVAIVYAGVSGRLTLFDYGYRESFAAASLGMFLASPLVGMGPALWPILRSSFTTPGQLDAYFPHAHDIYLQALAEFGIVGIAAGAVVLVLLARLVTAGLRSADPTWQKVGLAAVFSVVLLGAQQLVDMLMNVPALLLAMALPVAWLDARSLGEAGRLGAADRKVPGMGNVGGAAVGRGVAVGMVLITIASGVALVRSEMVATTARQGVNAANVGDWSAAAARLLDAAATDPDMPAFAYSAGIAAANDGDLATAARLLARSAAADDYPIAWLDLAAVRWRSGDVQGARDALDRAERLGQQRVAIALAAGWLRAQLGDHDLAKEDLAVAVQIEPGLLEDPFWGASEELSALRDEVEASVQSQIAQSLADRSSLPSVFRLALLSGHERAAEDAVSLMSPADQSTYGQILAAWQGQEEAQEALLARAQEDPGDTELIGWARTVAAIHGRADLVRRYDTWLWLANAPALNSPLVRVTFDATQSQTQVGLEHYDSLYRRPLPNAQIVLGLPQLEYQDHP